MISSPLDGDSVVAVTRSQETRSNVDLSVVVHDWSDRGRDSRVLRDKGLFGIGNFVQVVQSYLSINSCEA